MKNRMTCVQTYIFAASRPLRDDRMRCPSMAPDIGAASPP